MIEIISNRNVTLSHSDIKEWEGVTARHCKCMSLCIDAVQSLLQVPGNKEVCSSGVEENILDEVQVPHMFVENTTTLSVCSPAERSSQLIFLRMNVLVAHRLHHH